MKTSEELKNEIEKLKEEYREAKEREKIAVPDDIVFIDGVGWVKKLPFAPNIEVYVLGIDNTNSQRQKDFKLCNDLTDKNYVDWVRNYGHKVIIKQMPMRTAWYNSNIIGKRVFERKEDAIAKLKELFGDELIELET